MTWKSLGTKVHGNNLFFDRVRRNEGSYTVRKYDEVMQVFCDYWPHNAVWPAHVARPAPTDTDKLKQPQRAPKNRYSKEPAWWRERHPGIKWTPEQEKKPNVA
jgi:hypothetical protein